jgi:hypothetical protein
MWNGLDLEASSFIFFGGQCACYSNLFLHQLIVQHTFDLCPFIHNIENYTLIITNIICVNIVVVHPHNKHDSEHHLHQDCNNKWAIGQHVDQHYNGGAKAN